MTTDKFYTVPLTGKTTFYGPYYKPGSTLPPNRRAAKKRMRVIHKTSVYDHPKYVDTRGKKKSKKSGRNRPTRSTTPTHQVETYLKKIPVQISDADFVPRSSLKRHNSGKKSSGSVRIEEYGAKLTRGPSFYMNSNKKGIPYDKERSDLNSTLMYVNPDTDKIEPLKYSTEFQRKKGGDDDEPRYVVLPDFDERTENKDDNPLVIIDKEMTQHTKNQSELEDTYLTPVKVGMDNSV